MMSLNDENKELDELKLYILQLESENKRLKNSIKSLRNNNKSLLNGNKKLSSQLAKLKRENTKFENLMYNKGYEDGFSDAMNELEEEK